MELVQSPEWRILTFGGLRILRLGKELPRFETRKAAALVASLALDLGRTRSRDELAEMFWSGEYADLQRSSLRQALASIRRTLGDIGKGDEALVQADRLGVRLNPALCSTDISDFSRNVGLVDDPVALKKAIAIYTGPLLPESTEHNVVVFRGQCHDQLVKAHLQLSELLARNDPGQAIQVLTDALLHDPTNEQAMRMKMRLLNESGRRAEALVAFRAFADSLTRDLGVEPSQELEDLAASLRSDRTQKLVVLPTRPEPPALRSNVAQPLTPIFGRDEEIARLKERTDPDGPTRVTTITGPGGIGKTRLALETAWLQRETFGDAVWFLPLADVVDATEIPARVIDALGIRPSPDDEYGQIARHFQGRAGLIVLDNFEQILDRGVGVVKALLEASPRLKLIVTSREGLNVGYDTELPLEPLQTPSPEDLTADSLASVELFLDRARQAGSDILLNEQTRPTIMAICERLEGIPLAIVLAGARTQNRTPEELLAALDSRLDFLSADRRDLPDRHQTLRASIEWSYRLLPDFRTFFAKLSVFRGGWTAASASEICAEPDAEKLLEHLRRRSFVTQTGNRYGILETIREFAQDQVADDELTSLRERHARHFAKMAEVAHAEALGGKQVEWLAALSADEDNLRASMSWSLEHDVDLALGTSAFLWFHWDVRGHVREAHRWMQLAIDRADDSNDPVALGRALHGLGVTHRNLGDIPSARNALARCIEMYERAGEPKRLANPINSLGVLEYRQGNVDAARPLLERCLQIFEELDERQMVAMVRSNLGEVAVLEGDPQRAEAEISEALAINRELGNRVWEAQNLELLGSVALVMGDAERARAYYEECKELSTEVGKRSGAAFAIEGLAQLALMSGRYSEALQMLKDAGQVLYEAGRASSVAAVLLQASELAAHLGEGRLCARLLGASEREGGPGVARTLVSVNAVKTSEGTAAQLIGQEACETERAAGRQLSLEESLGLLGDLHIVSEETKV